MSIRTLRILSNFVDSDEVRVIGVGHAAVSLFFSFFRSFLLEMVTGAGEWGVGGREGAILKLRTPYSVLRTEIVAVSVWGRAREK